MRKRNALDFRTSVFDPPEGRQDAHSKRERDTALLSIKHVARAVKPRTPLMDVILEAVVTFSAVWVYGRKENPRHPFWRNSVRLIAFSGVLISTAYFLDLFGSFEFPLVITIIWAFCSLIVISTEYYLGSKKLGLAAFIAYPIWFAIAIATQVA